MRRSLCLSRYAVCLALMLTSHNAVAQLSFERVPIEYSKSEATDPVALLAKRIESGSTSLEDDAKFGYLVSLLRELEIPISSQSLVFAKNSLQRLKISPANPRAIYFNDETYLGYVPGGDLIEIASTDPLLGTVFYTVSQRSEMEPAAITRKTDQCLFCHASSNTGRVPGLMMQSVFTDSGGRRVFPQDSVFPQPAGALSGRWAGWFVTGRHGQQPHLGNLMIDSDDVVSSEMDLGNGNIVELSKWFDTEKYLSPHSDIVALLVLQHQVTLHNLLTDANHRSRILLHDSIRKNREAKRKDGYVDEEDAITLEQTAERVVNGLLMVGALELTEPVSGTSDFSAQFSQRGPNDAAGRSLRSLDLKERLFKYPCSYLIYSESFDSLPSPLLDRVYRRLLRVLDGRDESDQYAHLNSETRREILEILRATKQGLPGR